MSTPQNVTHWYAPPGTRDRAVSTGTEGSLIPLSAGHRRVNGALIWAAKNYTIKTMSVDQFFAQYRYAYPIPNIPYDPNKTQLTVYMLDMAFSFGHSLAPVDEKGAPRLIELRLQVQNAQAGLTEPQVAWHYLYGYFRKYFPDLIVEFYDGNEDQAPPPSFLVDNPNSPAYRGQTIAVLRNVPFGLYLSNTAAPLVFPICVAEMADGAEDTSEATLFTQLDPSVTNQRFNEISYDVTTGTIYTVHGDTTPNPEIRVWNAYTQTEVARIPIVGDERFSDDSTAPIANISFGDIWAGGDGNAHWNFEERLIFTKRGSTNSDPIFIINMDTGLITSQFGYQSSALGPTIDGPNLKNLPWLRHCHSKSGILVTSHYKEYIGILAYADGQFLHPTATLKEAAYKAAPTSTYLNFVMHYDFDKRQVLYAYGQYLYIIGWYWKGGFPIWGSPPPTGGPLPPGASTGPTPQLVLDAGAGWSIDGVIVYGDDKDMIIILTNTGINTTQVRRVRFINVLSQLTKWTVNITPHVLENDRKYKYDDVSQGTLVLAGGGASGEDAAIIDLELGQVTYKSAVIPNAYATIEQTNFWGGSDQLLYYTKSNTISACKLSVTNFEGLVLKDVLRWLCEYMGLTPDQYYVDPLLTDEIEGIMMNRVYDANTLFRDLGRAYNFSYFESDGKIKFVRASIGAGGYAAVAGSITLDEMAHIQEGAAADNECMIISLQKATATQSAIGIKYRAINAFLEYWANVVYNSDPTATSNVAATNTVELPIFMTAGEANRRAAKISVRQLQAAITQQFRLPWKWSLLEPADALELILHGKHYLVILTNVTYNGDWSISLLSENYAYSEDVADIEVDEPELPVTYPGYSDSQAIVADIPLIDPSLDQGDVLYVTAGVSGYGQLGWEGASLQSKLTTEDEYNEELIAQSQWPLGIVAAVLPDPGNTVWQTDNVTELTVSGLSLTSDMFGNADDDDSFYNGQNAILIGAPGRWELVYFRTVEVLGTRTVKLTGLLRGRRGTELSAGSHVAGDLAALVATAASDVDIGYHLVEHDVSDIGLTENWRAVGTSSRSVSARVLTVPFSGNSAKPWAVADKMATASSNDIVLTWSRRDRLWGEWVDGTGDITMSEVEELYDVEIYDGSGNLLRTVEDLTSPTYTYVEADQITDGFSPPLSAIEVEIYQKSALVGRGFAERVTLDVE